MQTAKEISPAFNLQFSPRTASVGRTLNFLAGADISRIHQISRSQAKNRLVPGAQTLWGRFDYVVYRTCVAAAEIILLSERGVSNGLHGQEIAFGEAFHGVAFGPDRLQTESSMTILS
jgi:hypothetical protein